MTIDLASYNEGVRAGRRDRQASRDELLELARQWAAEANHLRQVANNFDQRGMLNSGLISRTQGNQMTECADQLTRLLRAEEQPTEP